MRLITATWLALAFAALFAFPSYAAQDNSDVSVRVAIDLGDYSVVIGDTGDRYESWSDSPTRIRAKVMDSSGTREHYFDSLPAALFVLRQLYDEPRIVRMDVLDYTGQELIDGRQAYFVWDDQQQSRGGLPLVLAFGSYRAALAESRDRNSEVMYFDNVVKALDSWEAADRDQIYWRGSDSDRWTSDSWNSAWNNRWKGWGWDHKRGWSKADRKPGKGDQVSHRKSQGKSDRARGNGSQKNKSKGGNGKGGGKGHNK